MKVWTVFTVEKRCGYCGTSVPAGTPILVLSNPAFTRAFRRCQACAGDKPVDVERAAPRQVKPLDVKPLDMSRICGLAADWKHKRSGDER